MRVLVTGGAGYIGSHTVLSLADAGHEPVVVDSYVNAKPTVLPRLEELAGRPISAHRVNLTDAEDTERLFAEEQFDAVIHFAALKAVGESVRRPLEYYQNNLDSTFSLLRAMATHDVRRFVFSSSATVYGEKAPVPYREDFDDLSGRIGEAPHGVPNNLMPFLAQVAVGRRDKLTVFGADYPTADGTCERDYIHVTDLAEGHVAALDHLDDMAEQVRAFNLGAGTGTSVLELLHAFERAVGHELPYEVGPRRPGDLPAFWADPARAQAELGWRATRTIDDMCADTWRWQSENPHGFPD